MGRIAWRSLASTVYQTFQAFDLFSLLSSVVHLARREEHTPSTRLSFFFFLIFGQYSIMFLLFFICNFPSVGMGGMGDERRGKVAR